MKERGEVLGSNRNVNVEADNGCDTKRQREIGALKLGEIWEWKT